jgi:hypothetical protein
VRTRDPEGNAISSNGFRRDGSQFLIGPLSPEHEYRVRFLHARGTKVPHTPDWLHEIKHDGYRLRLERDGDHVRLITRGGYDWTNRYPWIVEAARKIRQKRFVLDGEAVILGVDGYSDFDALHSGKHNEEVKLLHRWRKEADQAGHPITRVVVAYEAGRDGFWLARWLRMRSVEAYVIHPNSIAVPREHRRAKTDRLDTELLLRALLGWLRGEKRHPSMVAIPTIEEEDAKRPNRERDSLVTEQTRIGNQIKAILTRFGIRRFRLKLRKAEQQLEELHSAKDHFSRKTPVQSCFVTSHVSTCA